MSIRRHLLTGLILGHTLGWLAVPQLSQAVSQSVLISEVQMAGSGSGHAGEEFIELYNASDSPVSLDQWTLRYHTAASGDCTGGWSVKYTASKVSIAPNGYWLVASASFTGTADGRFAAGLASAAGAIRVADGAGATVDSVGWGAGNTCAEGSSAAAVSDGHSLERRPGEDQPLAGNGVDTDENAADMLVRTVPDPQTSLAPAEVPNQLDTQSVSIPVYLPLELTELLIDPVSPATDAHDEYVEIHNPNAEPVQVAGYTLKSSSSSYHLLPLVLAPGAYAAVKSSVSHLSLSNTGGTLELDDPAGSPVYLVAPWPVAVPGAGWAQFEGGWRWTTQPSPAAANISADLEAPIPANSTAPTSQLYLPLRLTEVFPDPASPLTDASDEFVEIYNPNADPVDMGGYELRTGSNLGNSVTLASAVIPPGGYGAVKSDDTTLTLSNEGSNVQLLDPSGVQLDLIAYGTAKTGQSWMLDDGSWVWTTTTTPGSANVLTIDNGTPAASKAVKTTKAKAVKAAKISSPKVKGAAIKKTSAGNAPLVASTSTPGNNRWLLFVLAGLTIGYIIYEFRYDLRNYYHQLRGYAGTRR